MEANPMMQEIVNKLEDQMDFVKLISGNIHLEGCNLEACPAF
jgi:hypothetical protein